MNIHDVLKRSIGDELQKRDSLRWYSILNVVTDPQGNVGTVIVKEKRTGTIYHESLRFFLDRYLFRELPKIRERHKPQQ